MTERLIRGGFIAAGLINILGILLVSHGITSPTLVIADPAVFSDFGIIMIMLWGAAYIGSAQVAPTLVLLPAVFALEKAAYTLNWVNWMRANGDQLPLLIEQDLLGGLFLGGYGINDGLFCLFFAAVAIRNGRAARPR